MFAFVHLQDSHISVIKLGRRLCVPFLIHFRFRLRFQASELVYLLVLSQEQGWASIILPDRDAADGLEVR